MTDWLEPPERPRRRAYQAADLNTFIEHITARVTELEAQMAALLQTSAANPDAKPDRDAKAARPGETDRQARIRLAEAQRQAQARLAEADRYFATRLVEADVQAQIVLEQARSEGRALVDAVRRSLEEAIRLKDEEVLARLDQKLRQQDSR